MQVLVLQGQTVCYSYWLTVVVTVAVTVAAMETCLAIATFDEVAALGLDPVLIPDEPSG